MFSRDLFGPLASWGTHWACSEAKGAIASDGRRARCTPRGSSRGRWDHSMISVRVTFNDRTAGGLRSVAASATTRTPIVHGVPSVHRTPPETSTP